jgi:hypothetical protein
MDCQSYPILNLIFMQERKLFLSAAFTTALLPALSPAAPPKALFDGTSLNGWKASEFYHPGGVYVQDSVIVLERGSTATGITWTGAFPKVDYEVHLEACRLEGMDFFCGVTFPVEESCLTFIPGGWGGRVTGLSSLDGYDASDNETMSLIRYDLGKWYHIRIRVTDDSVRVWLDNKMIIDVATSERELSLREEVLPSRPFGIATWVTKAAIRKIELRLLQDD